MEQDHVWHDLAPDHGVLELDERLTATVFALELHLIYQSSTFAYWVTDRGEWLGDVPIGLA